MLGRSPLGRSLAVLSIAALACFLLAGVAGAAKPGKVAHPGAVVGQTPSPDVVNSKTIYDDGDGSSDIFYNAPPAIASGYQDWWYLVRGDIVSTTPPPPFDIETVSYYLRQTWNSSAGTVAVWSGANLTLPVFLGDDDSITTGFNNVTLTTPLTIPAVGTGVFWLGAINTFPVGATAIECTTCRVVGIDNVGANMPNNGFYITGEGSPGNQNITGATPLGASRVPIIRAGITATANTLPVELVEFGVD